MKTLIDNVARFPAATMNAFLASPNKIRDESMDTLSTVAKIWAREGLRQKVVELANRDGVTTSAKAALLRACRFDRNVH